MARLAYYAPGVYVEEIPSARQPIAGVGTNTVGFIGIVPDVVYIPVPNPDYDPMLTRDLLEFARLTAEQPQKDMGAEQDRLKQIEEMKTQFQRRLEVIDSEIKKLTENKADQEKAVEAANTKQTAAKTALDGLATTASADDKNAALQTLRAARKELVTANNDLSGTDTLLAQKTNDRQDINDQFEAAKTAAGTAATPAPATAVTPAPVAATGTPPAANAATVPPEQEVSDYQGTPLPADSPLLQRSVLRPYYLVPFNVKPDLFATKLCTNFTEYANLFGNFSAFIKGKDGNTVPISPGHHLLTHAVNGFFDNGGGTAFVCRISGPEGLKDALERFKSIEAVAILAAPGLPKQDDVWEQLETYCEDDAHQNVFAILDSPAVISDSNGNFDIEQLRYESPNRALPRKSTHAAFYLPHIEVSCPAKRLQDNDPAWGVAPKYRGRTYVAPSGHMAGIYARTDEERGVHKAPANTLVRGALEVKYYISKSKQELLNPQGVNCIRLMNGDVTVWGARTIGGDRNGEFKYIPVRRFMGFLEASIDQGTQWVVFEPNDTKLWSKIVMNITAFLTNVWRGGALFGLTPQEAFYVKCDAELNPPEVRDLGQVVTEIGVAIVRPAEFVIFRISQSSGQQQG